MIYIFWIERAKRSTVGFVNLKFNMIAGNNSLLLILLAFPVAELLQNDYEIIKKTGSLGAFGEGHGAERYSTKTKTPWFRSLN